MRRRHAITLVALAAGTPAGGQEAPRSYDAPRLSAAPVIDGRIDEAAWNAAAWTSPFVDIRGGDHPTPAWTTRAKMAWDGEHLYVVAELEEPHLWATLRERDDTIWHDHDFEIFLDPNDDGLSYYELEINALGTILDLFLERPYNRGGRGTLTWNMVGVRTAIGLEGTLNDASDEDRGWVVEMAIPWRGLVPPDTVVGPDGRRVSARAAGLHERDPAAGRAPSQGDVWRVNFSRVQWPLLVEHGRYRKAREPAHWLDHPEHNWVWSPQGEINMHIPERWGFVRFVGASR